MRVIGKKSIVIEIKEDKTKTGIYLSDEEMKKNNKDTKKARVVSSKIDGVNVGDTVIISRFFGKPFEYDQVEYLLLEEKDIEAVIHQED